MSDVSHAQGGSVAASTLKGVDVSFHTNDDDKDDDTYLEVWINMAGEKEAAYADVNGVGYSDNSDNNVHLNPKSNTMTWGNIPGAWLQIRIHPNGNDTWKFNVTARLNFDGGGWWQVSATNNVLDQDSTQLNVPLTA